MADIPDRIDLNVHRDLKSWGYNRTPRYVILSLFGLVVLLGLLNAFGQRPSTWRAESAKASLELTAPARVRGGLLYQARFTIRAHRQVDHAVLQLGPGWPEGQQMNTIEPSPIGETSHDGKLAFTLGTIPAGKKFVFYMQFQVDPTNVGRRDADVALYDGNERLFIIERTITVFP